MNCFLRANSAKIRQTLEDNNIKLCACCSFPDAEWLVYSGYESVHGVYPSNDDIKYGTKGLFGNKSTFKAIFLHEHSSYTDCKKDVNLFIKTIKG